MLEHMIGSGEDRGGEGADRPFRGGSGAQALELRLEIAAVFAGGRPSALDQSGLEPVGPLAHPGGSPLAGTLVIPGTKTGPGDQVSHGRKASSTTSSLTTPGRACFFRLYQVLPGTRDRVRA